MNHRSTHGLGRRIALARAVEIEALELRKLLSGVFSIPATVGPVPGGGDDPNDEIAEATIVTLGYTTDDSVNPESDVDMYGINVVAGQRIEFVASTSTDNYMRLFDASGNELAADDDSGPDASARIDFTFDTDGTYYFGVSGYGNYAYNAVDGSGDEFGVSGEYSLTVNEIIIPPDPDHRLGDATPIVVDGEAANASIEQGYDVDMYSFVVGAGDSVRIDAVTGGDDYLRLFDSAGNELASDDWGGGDYSARINYTFTDAGTYFAGVSGGGNYWYDPVTGNTDNQGCACDYILTVRTNDPDDQAYESGNEIYFASPVDDTVHLPTDVDLYRVYTDDAGGYPVRFGFDIDRPTGGNLDSYLRLIRFDDNSYVATQIGANDDAAAPGETVNSRDAYLEVTINAPGIYYIAVSGDSNRSYDIVSGNGDVAGSTGGYTLTANILPDTDDQANADEARPLAIGTPTSGRGISNDIDVDMYRFIAAPGQTLAFDLDRVANAGNLNSYLRIFNDDPERTQLAANDNGAAPGESAGTTESFIQYRFDHMGEYFVGVSGFPNASYDQNSGWGDRQGSTGQYVLRITQVSAAPAGDTDDQINEARTISVASPRLNQSIGSGTDVDMYRFTVAAGQRIGFDVDRTSGNLDSYLRIFRSDGTQVTANDDGVAPGETAGPSAYLARTFTSAGTYYVAVSGDPNRSYSPSTGGGDVSGSTGGYSLILTNLSAARGSDVRSPFAHVRLIAELDPESASAVEQVI